VCKPQCWQVTSSTPLKTTKMLLWFCCPMTTVTKSHASLLKVLGLSKPLLPKGWVYEPEEVRTKVKAEVANPAQYLTLDAPLMCSKRKALGPPGDPHPQSQQASNTIGALHSFPSISVTNMAAKCRCGTSTPILTLLTPL
jgi:hypothetical protein